MNQKTKVVTKQAGNSDFDLMIVVMKNCLATWLSPGLGYWLAGRKKSFAVVGGALLVAILMGILLGGDLFPLSSAEGKLRQVGAFCQMGFGIPYFLSRFVLDRGTPLDATYDYGTNYFLLAGMLNWLAVIDIFDISVRRK